MAGTIKLTLTMAVIFTILGELFIEKFLKLLNTPDDIMQNSIDYVRIIIAGICFISVYNMCANALRAVGDSTRPLICLIISIFLNIGMDLLFILVFDAGIKGAAYATIISQAISSVICLLVVFVKYKEIIPHGDDWKLSKIQYSNLITSGLSMGLMGCIVNIGTIILQSAINDLSTTYIIAHTAGRRVVDIMMIMINTIGVAMTTFVSQNLGAGKIDRIKTGVRHALIIDTIITLFLLIFDYTIGDDIVAWVASTSDSTILDSGIMYIRIAIWFFFVLGPLFILRCSLQGLGRKIVPLVSSGLELTTKVIFAKFMVPWLGYLGVALTEPVSWIIMVIPLIIIYVRVLYFGTYRAMS